MDKIKEKDDLNNNGIYVCPYGIWNFGIYDKKYWISQNGKIKLLDKKVDKNYYERYWIIFQEKYYPLLGIRGNEWYPLIDEDEDEEQLFYVHDNYDSIQKKYNTYLTSSNNVMNDSSKFLNYLEIYYNKTYMDL